MENNAPELGTKKEENFILVLDNQEFPIDISLNQGKISIRAVHNIETDILSYETINDFDSFIKIDEYFKYCKDINKVYDFLIQLKNSKALSLSRENGNINLLLHLTQPIQAIIKIPLNITKVDNKAIILSLNNENKHLREKIKLLEEELVSNNETLRNRLIKRDIKGYSQNLTFIEKEIEKQLKKEVISYDLLYKATKDGDKSENFHSKCDNIENTLIIIKTTNNEIFGGFTTKCWNSLGYINDPKAFVFSINNQKIYNIIDNKNGNHAIYAHNGYGPCFGEGTDFGLHTGCTTKNCNWCYNKKTYNYNEERFIQSERFQVLDYEVYHVILE